MKILYSLLSFCMMSGTLSANPYPDPRRAPHIGIPDIALSQKILSVKEKKSHECLRILIAWENGSEEYSLFKATREDSCSDSFIRRSQKLPTLGSYRALIKNEKNGKILAYDSLGTGKEFRKLVSQLSFRFPLPQENVIFELQAEHPENGEMQKVYEVLVNPSKVVDGIKQEVEVRELKKSNLRDSLNFNIYAEAYLSSEKEIFFKDAEKIVRTTSSKIPGAEHFNYYAVFAPSKLRLGKATNLGLPIPERDSFLGLYFPYTWAGRWYHVLYPTREDRFRTALAQWPYDYVVALVKDSQYWGVGNYKELTAVPADHFSFSYLLLHEFGHFMGLNEEYSTGGPTELEFAEKISEPWSQNITFLRTPSQIKWKNLVADSTPLPTPASFWNTSSPVYGAYAGGYAESPGHEHSHIPGKSCIMEAAQDFCGVCKAALKDLVEFDTKF